MSALRQRKNLVAIKNMKNLKTFKTNFIRTKIVYTGIFFISYILYRMLGCPILEYLCGQSLEFFIPIFFILIYYALIGGLKLIIWGLRIIHITFNTNIIVDSIVEGLFYITTLMFLYNEAWYPYFYIRMSIIVLIDLVFAFFIFRKGFVFR